MTRTHSIQAATYSYANHLNYGQLAQTIVKRLSLLSQWEQLDIYFILILLAVYYSK